MKKSTQTEFLVKEMKNSVQELQNELRSLPNVQTPSCSSTEGTLPLVDLIPIASMASLLIEVVARIEDIIVGTEELACLAKFKPLH